MKKLSLKLLAYVSFPLVLICGYRELIEAYRFNNHCHTLHGEEPYDSLFDWYVNDFIQNEFDYED